MNRDDIIRLAQEAGGRIEHIGTNIAWVEFLPKNLERFAALVAAAEREACAKIRGERMNLREAAQQALEALEGWNNYGKWVWPESALAQAKRNTTEALTALRAALAEDSMQRLTDEQQMIERGTKAWAGVPDATAWVEELRGNEPVTNFHEKEGDKLSPPLGSYS